MSRRISEHVAMLYVDALTSDDPGPFNLAYWRMARKAVECGLLGDEIGAWMYLAPWRHTWPTGDE